MSKMRFYCGVSGVPQSPLAANWHLVRDLGLLAITNLNLKDFEPHQLQSVSPICSISQGSIMLHQHLLLARDLPNMFQPPLQLACRCWGSFWPQARSLKPAAPAAIFAPRGRVGARRAPHSGWLPVVRNAGFVMVYHGLPSSKGNDRCVDILWYFMIFCLSNMAMFHWYVRFSEGNMNNEQWTIG